MTDPRIDAIDLGSLSAEQLTELLNKTRQQIEDNERRQRKVSKNDKDVSAVAKQIKKLVETKVVLLENFVDALLQNLEINTKPTEQPAPEASEPPEASAPAETADDKPSTTPESPATPSKKPRAARTTKKRTPRKSGKIGLSKKGPTTSKKAPRTPAVRTINTGKKDVKVTSKRVFGSPKRYVHPENPDLTWEGVGKQPTWVAQCLEAGLTLADLSVK